MQFPVTLEIKQSRRLRAALLLVHLLAAAALAASGGHCLALAAGALALALSALHSLRPAVPVRLRLGRDGVLREINAAGDETPLALLPGAVVLGWLVVMRVRGEDGRLRSLVALADSLPPGQFRSLRIWIRWRAEFRPSGAPA